MRLAMRLAMMSFPSRAANYWDYKALIPLSQAAWDADRLRAEGGSDARGDGLTSVMGEDRVDGVVRGKAYSSVLV
jgi:hypothetical protein